MLDHVTAGELLGRPQFPQSEDYERPWYMPRLWYNDQGDLMVHQEEQRNIHDELCNRPLMRLTDPNSGSRMEADGVLRARGGRQLLRFREARKYSLEHHADYRNWDYATPYISFSGTQDAVDRNARIRQYRGRRNQTLTVTNPIVRFVKGLPVLDMKAEMRHYGIEDPYHQGYYLYKDEYLCLWEVTPEEIVGQ